ncbi:MAG: hypothetical protein MI867_26850 [Pseudomonadales bacterium]|nr:hypothetical protein [Pseudomonadales bacterium]
MESHKALPDSDNTIFLIDASIYIFRAWFGIPDHFFDDFSRSVNAVRGYGLFLQKFLRYARPTKVIAAFDESLETGYRHQLYEPYKANRALPDEDLAYQLERCKSLTTAMGITAVASDIYEADDLIAAVAKKRREKGEQVVVLSTDKDLAQMIGPRDFLWDFNGDCLWDQGALNESWGFPVERVADYLAIVGDSIDNIPGVAGVGAKSGQALCRAFADIEDLYANLDQVKHLPVRGAQKLQQKLADAERDVRLFKSLTLLHDQAKCSASDKAVKLQYRKLDSYGGWLNESGLTSILNTKWLSEFKGS